MKIATVFLVHSTVTLSEITINRKE